MKKKRKLTIAAVSVALCGVMGLAACGGGGGKAKYLVDGDVAAVDTTTGYTSAGGKFYSDYGTLDECHRAGKDLNVRLAEEGMVLLKNDNDALPLNRDERNITLLGIKSVDLQTGGGGSGNGNTGTSHKSPVLGADGKPVLDADGKPVTAYDSKYRIDPTTLVGSMENAGFRINKKVLDLYADNIADMSYEEYSPSSTSTQTLTRELPMSYYNSMITNTYRAYNDAAVITFSRTGAEGLDEIAHEDSHVLQLTEEEKALVRHAKSNFKKVIVLINTGNVMELGELDAPKTADNLGVDAILYIGHVGNDGAAAIGEILNGTVNPSGHTVDLWSMAISNDPSYTNFGDMTQNGEAYDNYFYLGEDKTTYHSVEYREDIYVGYRYYETVAADMNKNKKGSGDTWYENNVVYPFGHGLSYTTFDWELCEDIAPTGKITAPDNEITVKVKVTNTGEVTGKDVVQLYATQPYTKGGIEKAERVLVTYGKTGLLKPGYSETVTLKFAAQDMASFDWQDKNNNGFVGYELEAGDYIISAARDSHTPVLSVKRTVKKGINCETDLDTGKKINAVFSQTDGEYAKYNTTNDSLINNLISREGGLKQPEPASKADRTVNRAWIDMMEGYKSYAPLTDDAQNSQFNVTSVPSTWTQAESHAADYSDVTINIGDMSGVDYTLNKVENGAVVQGTDDGSKKWEEFMNQLTWAELCQLASQGSYGRPSVKSINLPFQMDIDGPCQIAWYGNQQANNYYAAESEEEAAMIAETADGMGTFWVGAVLIASTWNAELAEKQGVMVGNESMLTNSPGWYGPGCNMHRSALGGRNFEYYSEDPVLAGTICGSVVRGVTSKGTIAYVKHMFLNDQETNREGICTYATEQAIREIYLKPFEYILKEGRSLGTMGAGMRLGNVELYKSSALYNGILRDEWDFKGINITDSVAGRNHPDMDEMLRAGIDCPLGAGLPTAAAPEAKPNDLTVGEWDASAKAVKIDGAVSHAQWYAVRNAALHVLYATANSNGIDNGIVIKDITSEFNGGMVNANIFEPSIINALAFSDVTLVESDLPTTVSVNRLGVISGRFDTSGNYKVKLSMLIDGWIPKTIGVNIVVKDIISVSGTVTAGQEISGVALANSAYTAGETLITGTGMVTGIPGASSPVPMPNSTVTCSNVTYASEDLPEGITLAADGTLSGALDSGTYTITVVLTASGSDMYYGYFPRTVTVTFTQQITITVA